MDKLQSRGIPSLDGLRALSVLAVILGHSRATLPPFLIFLRNGDQGVAVFFVLSGFLITHLLLKELNRTGGLDLKRFYFRRTFRIFPPFYVFLGVVILLTAFHIAQVSGLALFAAASFTWNYATLPPVAWVAGHSSLPSESWVLAHCWSLSLEEQFYLLWPACMASFTKRVNFRIAFGVILLSPLSRIVTYYAWPSMRSHEDMMLHTHLDTIMVGCLLSLMLDMKVWQGVVKLALNWWAPVASLIFLVALDTPAEMRWRGMYKMPIGISLENLAIAVIVLFGIFRHNSFLGKVLNSRPLRHLGIISYSLYLWQQLFTGPYTNFFPLNIVLIVLVAEASYWIVERPSFALRDRIGSRLFARKTRTTQEAVASVPSVT